MNSKKFKSFIKEIPKCDLHVHLDGSINPKTLIDLAKKEKVKLPSYTVEGLNKLLFKDKYKDLPDYIAGFDYAVAVMQNKENLEHIAYNFAWDNINEGVCYVELRFAPQLHVNKNMNVEEVVEAVHKGMLKAKKEYNKTYEVKKGLKSPFEYGIIACAMRFVSYSSAEYFKDFMHCHPYSVPSRLSALASYELVLAMIKARDKKEVPIVGFDLAGPEAGFPPNIHKEAYDLAHKNFFKKTVHAGEAYGAESIFQAITELHADRIGHGFYLFSPEAIKSKNIKNKKVYIEALAQYIADQRITIEVCLTSNMQTNQNLKNLKDHTLNKMLKHRLSATLCTDNRTVSKTSVSREMELAYDTFKLKPKDIKNFIVYGLKRSFYPGTYLEKRNYVRKIIDLYDSVEKKYKDIF
jgi:adenosine deaminase